MKVVRFHPEALAELRAQALFYEERSVGLGERFATQVEEATNLAASMPGVGSKHKYRTRRVFPKDFPYSVIYRETEHELIILAVAAFKRKPGYWRGRK